MDADLVKKGIPSFDLEEMVASDDEFTTPYNTPHESPLHTGYAVNKVGNDFVDEELPVDYKVPKLELEDRDIEIEEMEELRRRQGSRLSRANRPKAARPRRGHQAKDDSVYPGETVDHQMMVDREEESESDESDIEKEVVLKKKKIRD